MTHWRESLEFVPGPRNLSNSGGDHMATDTKTVLITGASSGIGRSTVARMVRSGWSVFATVRKEHDGAQLRSDFGARVIPIIMDVTDRRSIGYSRPARLKIGIE